MTEFPIDLDAYQPIALDANNPVLSDEQRTALKENIQLCRDALVFFTATGAARGVGGHSGGPFDTVPEVMIMDALFRGANDQYVPIFFDEAGHRVGTQYLMAALHGELPVENLMQYRAAHSHLPGHPELGYTPGVKFSSGRLGHMWPYVNGRRDTALSSLPEVHRAVPPLNTGCPHGALLHQRKWARTGR